MHNNSRNINKVFSIVLFISISLNGFCQVSTEQLAISNKSDSLHELRIESVTLTKPRNVFGIKLNHNKLIVKDIVYDQNRIVQSGTSKFTVSGDASTTIMFSRIKIRKNMVVKYKTGFLRNNGCIINYDRTGKKKTKIKMNKSLVISEYMK